MKKRITVITNDAYDGCAFYRAVGPFGHLEQHCSDLDFYYCTSPDWGKLRSSHLVFILRPASQPSMEIMLRAKGFGIPVWIDYDDDLSVMKADNPSFSFYTAPSTIKMIDNFVRMADVITVTTNELKKKFSPINKNTFCVPNAMDPKVFKYRPKKALERMVFWRGTATHSRDLMQYREQILKVSKENPELLWAFLGPDPWFITEEIPSAIRFPEARALGYWEAIGSIRPSIMMVPLADTSFNRSKSNIAAMEGAFCGAASLVPDWEEWQLPGVHKYTNDFYEKLTEMIHEDPAVLKKDADETFAYVMDKLHLDAVNPLRRRIIDDFSCL